MKKILFLIVAVIIIAIIPNVYADEEWFGEIEASIGSDTLIDGELPASVGSKTENASVTYDSVKLKYVPAEGKTKPGPMAWLGIKVTAPSGVKDKTDANNVKYYPVGDESNPRNFFEKKDSKSDDAPYYIFLYNSVTQEKLEDACKKGIEKLELGKWVFTWDEKGEHKQTFTIYINTKTVTLVNEKDEDLFTPDDAEKLINEYKESQKQEEQTKQETEKNKNPNTSDINIVLTVGTIFVSALCIGYIFKKRFN